MADAEDASEDLKLSWVGDENVQLEVAGGRLVVSANTDWTGREEITLIVEDSGQLKASGPLVVARRSLTAPSLVAQPDHISPASGESHVLSLDELVVDPDDADDTLSWQVSGHGELSVQLRVTAWRALEHQTDIGVETLLFTVTDPTGEQTSFSLKVYSLPASGEPLLAALPEVRVPLDGIDSSIDLDLYLFDLDHAPSEIDFFSPQREDVSLRVDEQSHVLVIQPQAGAVLPSGYRGACGGPGRKPSNADSAPIFARCQWTERTADGALTSTQSRITRGSDTYLFLGRLRHR